ncbi:phage major capsid protein [Salinisphaera sp. LB1]|uniref:phage major capsid protein n=1 Tax=Salinisphaera sp. LB1 TaxID=2183911 RepID=UPI000D705A02|nr:phage major capsid protein [Salinisphaera sp. LB1]AWN17679.1 Phage major capsid protein [Salinisphaera sp. LB1]
MSDLDTAVKALDEKLGEGFKKYEAEVKEAGKASEKTAADVKAMAEDFEQYKSEAEARIKELEQGAADGYKSGEQASKSWGEEFTKSEDFQAFASKQRQNATVEVKNTILNGSVSAGSENGIVVTDNRGIIGNPLASLTLLNVVPTGATSGNNVEYSREKVYTNNAAEVAEGSASPESDIEVETVNDPVRDVSHFVTISRNSLDDVPAMQTFVNSRLLNGVRSRLQKQIIIGDGTGQNLSGVSVTGRHTDFTPASGDTSIDNIRKAKAVVQSADYDPTFIVMNPVDFADLELSKTSTKSYVAGSSITYVQTGLGNVPTLWGMPVVQSNAMAQGKFMVADSQTMMLMMRQQAQVEAFEQHGTNAASGLIMVRATVRAAFTVPLPNGIVYGDLVYSGT